MGVACAAPPSLKVHSSLPFLASNARKRPSSVEPTKTSPPAVAMVPPFPGRPVFCLSGGRVSVTPSGTRHANSPVFTLTAVNCPQGGVRPRKLSALPSPRVALCGLLLYYRTDHQEAT